MRALLNEYYSGGLSRRGFLGRLMAAGFTAAAAARAGIRSVVLVPSNLEQQLFYSLEDAKLT